MIKNKKAFTFIELVISAVIIVVLSTIWFYSYVWHLSEARDSQRKADEGLLNAHLQEYKQNRSLYPIPWEYFNITNTVNSSTYTVAYQWKMNKDVSLSNLDKLPLDPLIKEAYVYSTTKNRQEYQIAMTLENWDFPIALLSWEYKTVSYEVLPSIVLAIETWTWTNIEIHDWVWDWSTNRQLFVLDKWDNLAYSLNEPYNPVYWYSWLDIWTDIISKWKVEFWQNSDFVNCLEIDDARKYIHDSWTETYNIRDWSWMLTNTWCTIP